MIVAVLLASVLPPGGSAQAQVQGQAQTQVAAPGDPEIPNPAAVTAPSTSATPGALVRESAHALVEGKVGDAVKDDIKALRRGPLLIHGNYCGIGNRPGTPPVDLLDIACMHHDECTHTGKAPDCACDERLHDEAVTIAQDTRTPASLKVLATGVAASMAVLFCSNRRDGDGVPPAPGVPER